MPDVHIGEGLRIAREAIRFPVELHRPRGFRVNDPATWPRIPGRLEYVEGRLLYMPPCGDEQGAVAVDVTYVLRAWSERHREFAVRGNEIGILLGNEVRGAEAGIWRRSDVKPRRKGYLRVAPLLVAEVAGQDEGEDELREKAAWYLDRGVRIVWLVFPDTREVLVLQRGRERRFRAGERLLPLPELPDLAPEVSSFFSQLR